MGEGAGSEVKKEKPGKEAGAAEDAHRSGKAASSARSKEEKKERKRKKKEKKRRKERKKRKTHTDAAEVRKFGEKGRDSSGSTQDQTGDGATSALKVEHAGGRGNARRKR